MALVLKDRVKETSVTTGTGDIALGGATGTYQTFSIIGNGNQTYYCIAGQTTTEWEVGIGTYVSSGDKITRDTILASSNSNLIVTFSAGTKDVFVTYPSEKGVWLDASDDSNSAATIGTTPVKLGATSLTLAGLTSVTVTQDPSVALDLATKQYVDTLVSSGITYHTAVKYEVPDTTGNLTATYSNGTAGVGATLTNAGTQVAFTPDGIVASVNDRVLVYNQTNAFENGVYTVTTVGSGATNWVLTRATDADSYGLKDPDALGNGDAFFVSSGNTGAGETYVCNTVGVITFGTTAINFEQISSSQVYTAGTGLTLSPATTFNIANTTVTAASYGAVSKTLTATVNAQGQLTALADTDIAIAMSQVTSGTLGATQGGTGQSSYAVGDILYADTTTSLARLADVATGNALISGGLNTAPSWGKIALASAVSGTLGVANGGTGVTTSTGSGSVVLSTSPTLITPILGTPQSGNFSTGTFTWPTFNQNTTGTAGNVSGTVAVANGGTGSTTAQTAINTLAGATTSGYYLRGNGTNAVMAAIVAGDVPTLNQNTTGSAGSVANSVTFNNGGAGAASGTTYNGSAAQTISYNTVGAYAATNPSGFTSNTGTVTSVSGGSYLTGGTITTSGTLAVDATTTNTASKVVARDASGNFSAGTITATLSGNATTATTASGVSASADQAIVNQNNGNSHVWYGRILSKNATSDKAAFLGTYAGIAGVFSHNNALNAWADLYVNTVDGSVGGDVRLPSNTFINGNQSIHAGNYNSYAPTLTGTGASGTWGISVTGNAATATNANGVDITGYGSDNGTYYQTYEPFAGYSSGWAGYWVSNHGNGATYYNQTLIMPFWEAPKYSRLEAGTFKGPYTFITTENQTSYTPTLTGTGASGTWGIAISGNAATATTASSCSGNAATATKLSTASGSAPSYSARAWVNFNGQGTIAIRASGNVSSITDNGAGRYQVNFTTDMDDTNYAILASTSGGVAGQFPGTPSVNSTINLTSRAPLVNNFTFFICAWNNTAVGIDEPWLMVSVFR